VASAINDPNEYRGPGTGFQMSRERHQEIACIPQAEEPRKIGQSRSVRVLRELGEALGGTDPREIVIAVGPAFGTALQETLLGLDHESVLRALVSGVREEGLAARVVKIYSTSDCGFIGHAGAKLSGSGISIGIQSKGTTVIHQRDLEPLNNLELFPQAPNLTLESYKVIGRNAAKYAKGEPVLPVPVQIDNMARLKYIVKTTILHLRETEQVRPSESAREVEF
jgi:propanediol dehydratase medium subunit